MKTEDRTYAEKIHDMGQRVIAALPDPGADSFDVEHGFAALAVVLRNVGSMFPRGMSTLEVLAGVVMCTEEDSWPEMVMGPKGHVFIRAPLFHPDNMPDRIAEHAKRVAVSTTRSKKRAHDRATAGYRRGRR